MMLSSRQVRTLEWLLDRGAPTSVTDVAAAVRLSPRMVRSDLAGIERFLVEFGVAVERRRGLGIWLTGTDDDMARARSRISAIDPAHTVHVYSPEDRLLLILFELLSAAPGSVTVDALRRTLQVSISSARRDVARAEAWLDRRDLYLARQPGVGMSVIAPEGAIRRALVKLVLEAVPANAVFSGTPDSTWWKVPGISAGIREYLRLIPLDSSMAILSESETQQSHAGVTYRWLAADLAIALYRLSAGHQLDIEPGALRSLRDHPMWEMAEALAASLGEASGIELGESEIGGVTERLLAVSELAGPPAANGDEQGTLAREALGVAAARLHPGLADDRELLTSLIHHVERLRVRLRYGLPVHNPLLREVSTRYPDVHEVALVIADRIGDRLGEPLSDDEAGFITMYLSGSLERLRLRPRSRAVVVCPTGIASAWILVSRIQTEFPELDLVEVLSARSIDEASLDADLVISTVDIGETIRGVPVLVVSPLLPAEDVRRVATHV